MTFVSNIILDLFGQEVTMEPVLKNVGGGCIHQAGVFEFKGNMFFVKWNHSSAQMFESEARGLTMLRDTCTLAVPMTIGHGSVEEIDYLCLEYHETGVPKEDFWKAFGYSLAALHHVSSDQFGLDHNNYIGSLPQINNTHHSWSKFFVTQRLEPQLRLAYDHGVVTKTLMDQFQSLFNDLEDLLPIEKPALLHGDLWSGNFLIGSDGAAVVFDPAVYYGHREAEIAFTKMFGGYDPVFYHAYQEVFPMEHKHEERVDIFNLYPLLVHVNLFGASYLRGIQQTLSRLT